MQIIEILRLIVINLTQNKAKVFLTSLGIIIGTLTIILVIAIGRGGEEQIARQYSNMSAETIYVNVSFYPDMDFNAIPHITAEHLSTIVSENPYLKGIYLRTTTFQEVKVGHEKKQVIFAAVTSGYSEISNFPLDAGTDFADTDYDDARKVIVLGYDIAKELFGSSESAVGEYIQIGNYRYEIIGVLRKKSEGLQGLSPDTSAFIPLQTAQANNMLDTYSIPQAVGLASSTDVIQPAMNRLKSSLDYLLDDSSMYIIEDAGGRIEAAMASARTMKLLLISVSAIVFLVGGIGIMNVLFVSVKERTKEIGILKAIGTSKKDILLLFLLESVGIGVFGGFIGIILSWIILPCMKYTHIAILPSLNGYIVAFCFAVITAALFGLYPAYKAAQLKPIDALSFE